jgi:hypothetical protein
MRSNRLIGFTIALLVFSGVAALAQWGAGGVWTVPSGGLYLNCPANSCSVTGQTLNFPGLSAKSQLLADSAGSATTALVNSGISFPLAAGETGTLDCEVLFTNGSGGGLTLAINGPGTPTQVSIHGSIVSAVTTTNQYYSQGATWAVALGAATSTVTTIQSARITAGIENGTTAGTLALQFSDVNTTGSTVIKRDSWCSFP